jgi:uncharacterized protein YacL
VSGRGALVRAALVALAALLGAAAAQRAGLPVASGVLAGGVLAALAIAAEAAAARARIDRLVGGALGGTLGLAAGWAGRAGIESVPGAGPLAATLAPLVCLLLGVAVGLRRGPDVIGLNAPGFRRPGAAGATKLLDTSAIIDGRIADLAATGFLDGPLVVPEFVLRELQQVADSRDARRRARGKRGFDVVQRLRRLPGGLVEIDAVDVPGVADVDRKLIEIAKARGAKVVTTDYNLNRLAELSGVAVLNINDVANAMKSAAVAGEAMQVQVLREGKESGQGVAYLDDGTMIVVDQGKRWIGQTVDVVVTSVLQTPSGRIIFTRLRDEEGARA